MTASLGRLAKGPRRSGRAASTAPSASPWNLPAGLARRWEALWDAQFWCFGQDVVDPQENLLAAYGFERRPAPPGVEARSSYALASDGGETLQLWGFGGWWGRPEGDGLFILRVGREGRWLRPAKARTIPYLFRLEDLPAGDAPSPAEREIVHQRMRRATAWAIDYETWATARRGPEHRRAALARWRKATFSDEPLVEAWERFRAAWTEGALHAAA